MARISPLIKNNFDPVIRQQGRDYHDDGVVTLLKTTRDAVFARVDGTQSYGVELRLIKNRLSVSCACLYFKKYGACSHVWAAILAAETEGCYDSLTTKKLHLAYGIPKKKSFHDQTGQDEDDCDDDDFFDEIELEEEAAASAEQRAFQKRLLESITRDFKPGKPPLIEDQIPYSSQKGKKRNAPVWDGMLKATAAMQDTYTPGDRFGGRQILYGLNVAKTLSLNKLVIETFAMQKGADVSTRKPLPLTPGDADTVTTELDRKALLTLFGAAAFGDSFGGSQWQSVSAFFLPFACQTDVIPHLCDTGRFFLIDHTNHFTGPFRLDTDIPWELKLKILPAENCYRLHGAVWRNGQSRLLNEPLLVTAQGYAYWPDHTVSTLDDKGCFPFAAFLRKEKSFPIQKTEVQQFIADYLALKQRAPLDLPEELRYEEVRCAPSILLRITTPKEEFNRKNLRAKLLFRYHDKEYPSASRITDVYDQAANRVILRDRAVESAAAEKLDSLGFRRIVAWSDSDASAEGLFSFPEKSLLPVVGTLLADQWKVEAEGVLYRKPGDFSVSVASSGIDWFDLTVECDFCGMKATLPALLAALKKGERFVRLGDGSLGILPEEWLNRYRPFAGMGEEQDGCIRFRKSQAMIIDLLLKDTEQVCCDEVFERLRNGLKTFCGIQPVDPGPLFRGVLRPYQREGLGWLHFLQQFGFGGCLADDMGLGKTIQVLSHFASRGGHGTSLIVVPRSLIFNWKQEALRFAPHLRILDYSDAGRTSGIDSFDEYDLVLITYGVLRREIETLSQFFFDYVVLDEAQAIKNATTVTAKAVRLLKARHRLAMSGTPVENHLGELWSIFEFLNPGMLGKATVFKAAEASALIPDSETCGILRTALRPFILRRTKAQVAPDLPAKLEETLLCEMKPQQKKLYDELRDHYRAALLGELESVGINKMKIQILEALLRLRQAACHPGLVDPKRRSEPSAKLDVLIAQLTEVVQEGHKALVFSQFTSMLSLVQERIRPLKFQYEYLDGKTRDRQAHVEHFQNDPECSLFLISLKAGGLGLNLTAAEYVFLLDPWWNPAVEAQAIDRTHRIGQNRPVFAYRLICKDTVEEKVLLLQENKRQLAESIITADNSMIRTMRPEDLALLLS